jgi:hypothetical protein
MCHLQFLLEAARRIAHLRALQLEVRLQLLNLYT